MDIFEHNKKIVEVQTKLNSWFNGLKANLKGQKGLKCVETYNSFCNSLSLIVADAGNRILCRIMRADYPKMVVTVLSPEGNHEYTATFIYQDGSTETGDMLFTQLERAIAWTIHKTAVQTTLRESDLSPNEDALAGVTNEDSVAGDDENTSDGAEDVGVATVAVWFDGDHWVQTIERPDDTETWDLSFPMPERIEESDLKDAVGLVAHEVGLTITTDDVSVDLPRMHAWYEVPE